MVSAKEREQIAKDLADVEVAVKRSYAGQKRSATGGVMRDTPPVMRDTYARITSRKSGASNSGGEEKAVKHGRGKHGPGCISDLCAPRISPTPATRISQLQPRHRTAIMAVHNASQDGGLATQKEVQKQLGVTQSNVSRLLGELVTMEFIQLIKGSYPKAYCLTQKGKVAYPAVKDHAEVMRAITGPAPAPHNPAVDAQGKGLPPMRAHNLRINVAIHRLPREEDLKRSGWLLDTAMGWPRWRGQSLQGVAVHLTPTKMVVYLPEIWAHVVEEVPPRAFEMLKGVVGAFLEKFPTAVLGTPQVEQATSRVEFDLVQQHLAFVGDKFAAYCMERRASVKTDRVEVDASKGIPETEFVHPVKAQGDAERYAAMIHEVGDGVWDHLKESAALALQNAGAQDARFNLLQKELEVFLASLKAAHAQGEQRQVAMEASLLKTQKLFELVAEIQARQSLSAARADVASLGQVRSVPGGADVT